MRHKFEATYPWGSTYIEQLKCILDVIGVGFCSDPRQKGSDCWGLLVGSTPEVRAALVAQIQSALDAYDDECIDDDEWDDRLDQAIRDQGVARLLTDWKHLEVDDHAEQLSLIQLTLERLENTERPTFILDGPEPVFSFAAATPEEAAQELCSMLGERLTRHQALAAFEHSADRVAIARAILRDCRWEGSLTGTALLEERWCTEGATPTVLLDVVLRALGALPAEETRTLQTLDVSALERVPDAVGQLSGVEELRAGGIGGLFARFLHLPSTWPHRPRRVHIHNRRLGSLPAGLFTAAAHSAVEELDLSDSQAWLPSSIWHSRSLRRLRGDLSMLPHEGLTGYWAQWSFRPTGLQALELLDLGGTFETLPAWVGTLASLRRLTLRGSRLQHLPDALAQLPRLQVLDIGACVDLVTVPEALTSCTSLKMVRLVGGVGEDEHLDACFDGLKWRTLPAAIRDHPTLELVLIDAVLAKRVSSELAELRARGVNVLVVPHPHASLEPLHRKMLEEDPVADLDPRLTHELLNQVLLASLSDRGDGLELLFP